MYDFDTVYPRTGMGSMKWDSAQQAGCPPQVVPLTVADMEFRTAPEIVEAAEKLAHFGLWGYTGQNDAFRATVCRWMQKHNGWDARPEWIVGTPGVVSALYVAVRAFTQPGEGVLVQPPVYHPFFSAIRAGGRKIVENPLKFENRQYEIDFEDMERKAADCKMMIFCSPHNPVGRVWSEADVRRVADICARQGVTLVADEIHCDLIMPGGRFFSVGALGATALQNTVVCTSACKTFSLAGAPCSSIFIPGQALRQRFEQQLEEDGCELNDAFGTVATQVGYEKGAPWLAALIEYIQGNYATVKTYLAQNMPAITLLPMQGTYLAWLDMRALGMDKETLHGFLHEKAQLYANPGEMFGTGGAGHIRINLACPRSVLQGALQRLKTAMESESLI